MPSLGLTLLARTSRIEVAPHRVGMAVKCAACTGVWHRGKGPAVLAGRAGGCTWRGGRWDVCAFSKLLFTLLCLPVPAAQILVLASSSSSGTFPGEAWVLADPGGETEQPLWAGNLRSSGAGKDAEWKRLALQGEGSGALGGREEGTGA